MILKMERLPDVQGAFRVSGKGVRKRKDGWTVGRKEERQRPYDPNSYSAGKKCIVLISDHVRTGWALSLAGS